MDCGPFDRCFLSSLPSNLLVELPVDVKWIISGSVAVTNNSYLDTLSRLSLNPKFSSPVLVCYESLFPELVARWRAFASLGQMASCFGKLLPVMPFLVEMAEEILIASPTESAFLASLGQPELTSESNVVESLLSLHRLLYFKRNTFIRLVDIKTLYAMVKHESRAVRYLAVRILCIYLQVSDTEQQEMLEKYGVGQRSQKILGVWENQEIDYGFLTVIESRRLTLLEQSLEEARKNILSSSPGLPRIITAGDFSKWTVNLCGILLSCLKGRPANPTEITKTPTTCLNLQGIAASLRYSQPIILAGPAGAGKTFLVHHIAQSLNVLDTLVSIHLGDQTDAKILTGTYTTGDTPGSFQWREGILATAVREGRWVLVEDIDKAPMEVLSVLLPLIEHGELRIPSRGENIVASKGFRLIATIQMSHFSKQGHVSTFLGERLWRIVEIRMPEHSELHSIVNAQFHLLRTISPNVISVYDNIQCLYREPTFFALSKTSLGRQISPRDLFKWCTRINAHFNIADVKSTEQGLPEHLFDKIFREAVDCFAESLHTNEARRLIVSKIAEEMRIPSQRVDSFLNGHVPALLDSEQFLVVGRACLEKNLMELKRRKTPNGLSKRPFATTGHAVALLEKIGVAVQLAEPVLLVGETGTGKTTIVQQLAEMLGHNLAVINLSQQTEGSDLLGSYKPVDMRALAIPLKGAFDDLFERSFSTKKNHRFIDTLDRCWRKQQWDRVIILWKETVKMAEKRFGTHVTYEQTGDELDSAKKKRRLDPTEKHALLEKWSQLSQSIDSLERQCSRFSKSLVFSFVEGTLVKAARNGDWVLLDEINLAASDTLESIADLLKCGGDGSILLSDKGDVERIRAHPDFRIFGCMNPATDVGKRDLPSSLRSRFTELYVTSPDTDFQALLAIVREYIGHLYIRDERVCSDVAYLYQKARKLVEEHQLVDGADQKPHFSVRTLARTLSYAAEIASVYGLRRSLYEGFCMGFLTLLNRDSERLLLSLIDRYILGTQKTIRSSLSQVPTKPLDGQDYIQFQHYWMRQGPNKPEEQRDYIITPFVERNLLNLVRAIATRKFPILIQGPTSSGKTSMIEYLAKRTGYKFVRINNHEHTDLQEYLGTYVSDSDGSLHFREGVLVEALRRGQWIVLDELNLAPTDVLEALNRLLDDNRELLIPETQEIVRPHKDFMLFATQNPPGLYGGRKNLSRAFRNRFLELHFDDIPEEELETILREKCQVAPTYCKKIVLVYKELSRLRQSTRLFEQKNSFATLRDLFRWANREAVGYQQLAENGYMLLAERVRKEEERIAVKRVIEKEMRVTIDEKILYKKTMEYTLYASRVSAEDIVWTKSMQRLFSLVAHALRNNEPVLLVGETGCGKTTVCQMLALAFGKTLNIINAHQNTETGDIIGAQRPIRNRSVHKEALVMDLKTVLQEPGAVSETEDLERLWQTYIDLPGKDYISHEVKARIISNQTRINGLFEWVDGSLITAMKQGQFFLLDEISLADDSVLERLNSVLESQRSILLAEKGTEEPAITAADGFQFLATMNPGGDYGKKELSPALRNRFTEIWAQSLSDTEDMEEIVRSKLVANAQVYTETIVSFSKWFSRTYLSSAISISVRDVLAWVKFMNLFTDPVFGLVHGAAMVFIDALGANSSTDFLAKEDLVAQKKKCFARLSKLAGLDFSSFNEQAVLVHFEKSVLRLGEFKLSRKDGASGITFRLAAPTTAKNAMRVVRALQLRKPVLLEGNPGVGKTSLISALALASGNPLTRINLSEQTDVTDLFGSDIPVEDGQSGEFAWTDAPFLQAMQHGHWVLLDEMNLASQSVLEGLNACLDHRGEVYVAELDRTFTCHPHFTIFAAQNPHSQGGGRKGLPASFLNRFTVVHVEALHKDDLNLIATQLHPSVSKDIVSKLINFVVALDRELTATRSFGSNGAPWEFNLRDTLRWLELLSSNNGLSSHKPDDFIDIVIRHRFRSSHDRERIDNLFAQSFGYLPMKRSLYYGLSKNWFQVGHAALPRCRDARSIPPGAVAILKGQLPLLETLMTCVKNNMPCIITGSSGAGKSSAIKLLAGIIGANLCELPLNSDIDTTDLVGGFEQIDLSRKSSKVLEGIRTAVFQSIHNSVICGTPISVPLSQLAEFLQYSEGAPAIERLLYIVTQIRTMDQEIYAVYLRECEALITSYLKPAVPRFEWVDSMLVRAVEEGKWLVLDNANLCSPSVLDRLNSLLEPGGFLAVNEHNRVNGEPTLVRPHPSFRIFVTMDPRHGELSRAMRNRCVEVFVEPTILDADEHTRSRLARYTAPTEADSIFYQSMERILDTPLQAAVYFHLVRGVLDSVPCDQAGLLQRWGEQIATMPFVSSDKTLDIVTGVDTSLSLLSHPRVSRCIKDFLSSLCQTYSLEPSFMSTQPINPLRNTSLVSLQGRISFPVAPDIISGAIDCAKIIFEMCKAEDRLLKDSAINQRLDKSAIGNSIGVHLFRFLSVVRKALEGWLNRDFGDLMIINSHTISKIREIIFLWQDVVRLSSAVDFNEASFHVYLTLFEEWVESAWNILSKDIVQATNSALQIFGEPLKLITGSSMELMWNYMRPSVPGTIVSWQRYSELRTVMDRFDAVVGKGEMAMVSRIRDSMFQATKAIVEGAAVDELLKDLISTIERLEVSRTGWYMNDKGIFVSLFDTLMKMKAIYYIPGAGNCLQDVAYHARRPTANILAYHREAIGASFEQVLEDLWVYPKHDKPFKSPTSVLDSMFFLEALRSNDRIKRSEIGNLGELSVELRELAKHLTKSTLEITCNKIMQLNRLLVSKISQIFAIHKDSYVQSDYLSLWAGVEALKGVIQGQPPPTSTLGIQKLAIKSSNLSFRAVASEHLVPVLDALVDPSIKTSPYMSGQAWIHYTMGCIKLYVPDIPFDPAMKALVQRERYIQRKTTLENRMEAENVLESKFTGHHNFETTLLERLYHELGDGPPIPLITRPRSSRISALQGEFSTLIQIVIKAEPHKRLLPLVLGRIGNFSEQESLFQQNLTSIAERLQIGYPLYKDIIDPVIGFIYALKLGFNLCGIEDKGVNLGLNLLLNPVPRSPESIDLSANHGEEIQIFYLWQYAARSFIEGWKSFDNISRKNMYEIFQHFFQRWQSESFEAQEKAAADSKLYRYRGEDEKVEQQDFRRMFPTYDTCSTEDEPMKEDSRSAHRELASQIAQCQSVIYTDGSESKTSLQSLILRGVSILTREAHVPSGAMNPQDILLAIVLSFKKTCDWTRGIETPSKVYDFYTDQNLEQIHLLVAIVKKIQIKLLHLLEQWPENITLLDTLEACRQLLSLPNFTPVARLLTKLESLHGLLDEWKKVARASDDVGQYFNEVTRLIISWRKLELSAWRRLFDTEDEKCRKDADAWWFFVYENVVADPVKLLIANQSLRQHTESLISVLIKFFESSTVGQFHYRLQLVRVFERQVSHLEMDFLAMKEVRCALSNLVTYYSQYESSVQESGRIERKHLEKEVTEVVLLASWKDANIHALRESARRSHVVLYKIVKKYRQALESPIGMFLERGMPTPNNSPSACITLPIDAQPKIDMTLVKRIYEASIGKWDRRPARLQDIFGTVSVMQRVAERPEGILNPSEFFHSFCSSLLATIKQLQAETPSALTEQNLATVKHLKSRKRKAFVDVLKELRLMGLKSNLGSDVLKKQATLEIVLANTASVGEDSPFDFLKTSQTYFMRTLELITRVRSAMRQHSEDLTSAEAKRSIGYLEDLLSLNIKQQSTIVSASTSIRELLEIAGQYANLSKTNSPAQFFSGDLNVLNDIHRLFQWLPEIFDLSIKTLSIHSEFSNTPFEALLETLGGFQALAVAIRDRFVAEEGPHDDIWETSTKALFDDAHIFLASLRINLENISSQRPEIAYIVKPLMPWTIPLATESQKVQQTSSVQQLDDSLRSLCDSIYVALQRLSEAQSQYPLVQRQESPGWLVRHQKALFASVRALHLSDILRRAHDVLTLPSQMQSSNLETSHTIRALFAAHFPVFYEYVKISISVVQQVAINHCATCKTTYVLCKAAEPLLSKGFCTPSEKNDEGGMNGTIEDGTGLGDGEGVEDISKDIGLEEDLSEISHDRGKQEQADDIEEEKDAVDMGADDMEGETGDKECAEEENGSNNGDENEIDEETGHVDSLDPTTVDEKLWNQEGQDNTREKGDVQGQQPVGSDMEAVKKDFEERQKGGNKDADENIGEDNGEAGADQDDEVRQQELDGMEKHVPEADALELPEDMDLEPNENIDTDGDNDITTDGVTNFGLDDETAVEDKDQAEIEPSPDPGTTEIEISQDPKGIEHEDGKERENTAEVERESLVDDDERSDISQERPDKNTSKAQNDGPEEINYQTPSDAQTTNGISEQQDPSESCSAKQQGGEKTKTDEAPVGKETDKAESENQNGEKTHLESIEQLRDQGTGQSEIKEDSSFRKLGDILEKWHQQHQRILNAQDDTNQPCISEMELSGADFEHLANDEAMPDTQVLGKATEDQAQVLDGSMAVDSAVLEKHYAFEDEDGPNEESITPEEVKKPEQEGEDSMRPGAVIGELNPSAAQHKKKCTEDGTMCSDRAPHDSMDVADLHISPELSTLLSTAPREVARKIWMKYESTTRSLSAGLCEQLRLILEPTQAARLRGDFRTGKRLNMKRIIPYIASSYKKDKIWMRRAKPSKRQYQVILAVDNSKSMSESSSSGLALETVALVARALSSLEVGQISILSFGDTTHVVHPFDKPFTMESGVDTFSWFKFDQKKTDVRGLIEVSLSLFEKARFVASSSPVDIWQLQIIISDAICQEHETLRRLIRGARDQRVMLVFIIMDNTRQSSIVDLTTIKFENGGVVSERYLDTFPFEYYLVVSDVKELPSVLTSALRQWFTESVDKAG